ncbi:conserved hypothetical protein [Thermosulfidibacter takaii ABI70S6]|uniref:Uncharacterized protein n=2 Tax=Thermosulfidibacter takaii TaxID=412593 RepID=A0A0S3QR87_THET7|nr:conserved hypothetical protein [Thermosulfidibacter takaii ABI70S6]
MTDAFRLLLEGHLLMAFNANPLWPMVVVLFMGFFFWGSKADGFFRRFHFYEMGLLLTIGWWIFRLCTGR